MFNFLSILAVLGLTGTYNVAVAIEDAQVERYGYKIVQSYPHDSKAFTQGLFFDGGYLYESTGLYGTSTVRKVSIDDGKVQKLHRMSRRHFGEGSVGWNGKIYVLTWRQQTGFVIDQHSFRVERQFYYRGEGWGLTHNGHALIMSDGTDKLRYLDPDSFNEIKEVSVTLDGNPVPRINELEWIEGEIFANVWQSDLILRIDPETGKVKGIIDLTGIIEDGIVPDRRNNVLNGIAYDPATKRLFVTGKNWPTLFEIELVKANEDK
jgi:glutaminyl-peptide cyclotransferase